MAADDATITLSQAVLQARRRLAEAGIETPDLDARILAGHALGLDRVQMITDSRRLLDADDLNRIAALVARRLDREPVGRILGTREFWGLDFTLGPDTLEPRPDSETAVQAALDFIDSRNGGKGRGAPLHIVDLGTGTGCLLVALLSELPSAYGIGVDVSASALAVAKANARANGVGDRTGFVACDWTAALADSSEHGGFDVIIANPPYIPSSDCAGLARDVVEFDPIAALDGGADGLDAYRAILADAARVLAPSGGVVLEFGAGQREAVAALAAERGLAVGATQHDLNGIERVLVLTLSCA